MPHWPLPTTQITHHLSFTQDKQQRAHIYLFFLTINITQQLTRSPDQLPLEWYFYQVSSTILNSTPGPSNSVFTWKDPAQYRTKALYGILCLPERVRLQMTAELINDQALCIYLPCVLVLVLYAASSYKQTISSRRPKGWRSGLISRGSDEMLWPGAPWGREAGS